MSTQETRLGESLALSLLATIRANRDDNADGCSYWLGDLDGGYPTLSFHVRFFVHRFVCAMWWGPDAVAGFDVHHLCEHKTCVNPAHLVPLTKGEHGLAHAWEFFPFARRAPRGEQNVGLCLDAARNETKPVEYLEFIQWPSSSKATVAHRIAARRTAEAA